MSSFKTFTVNFSEVRLYSKRIKANSPDDALQRADALWMRTRPTKARHFTLDDIVTEGWEAEEVQP
jgi:hypothetical protein